MKKSYLQLIQDVERFEGLIAEYQQKTGLDTAQYFEVLCKCYQELSIAQEEIIETQAKIIKKYAPLDKEKQNNKGTVDSVTGVVALYAGSQFYNTIPFMGHFIGGAMIAMGGFFLIIGVNQLVSPGKFEEKYEEIKDLPDKQQEKEAGAFLKEQNYSDTIITPFFMKLDFSGHDQMRKEAYEEYEKGK